VVLSHDTSGCSCIFVALPPPSDAVPACWCASTPVMRAAVCLLYVSAVKRRRVAVLHVYPLRHSLFAVAVFFCCCCFVVVVYQALVRTYMASLGSRCDSRERRGVTGLCGGMKA
jgi:hypothetical protein